MGQNEKPKQPVRKSEDSKKTAELKTDLPISEKDEVKQAENRMKRTRKSL